MLLDKDVIDLLFYNKQQLTTDKQKELIKTSLTKYGYKTCATYNTTNFSKHIVAELFDLMGVSYKEHNIYDFIIDDDIGILIKAGLYDKRNMDTTVFGLPYSHRYIHKTFKQVYIILMMNYELIDIPNDDITNEFINFFASKGFYFKYFTGLIYSMDINLPIQWNNTPSQTIDISDIVNTITQAIIYQDCSLGSGLNLLNTIRNHGLSIQQYNINDDTTYNVHVYKIIRDHLNELLAMLNKYEQLYNKSKDSGTKQFYVKILTYFNNCIANNIYRVNAICALFLINKLCLHNELITNEDNIVISSFGNPNEITFDYNNLKRLSLLLNSVNMSYNTLDNTSIKQAVVISVNVNDKNNTIRIRTI